MNSVFKNALVWVLLGSALIFIFNNVENASASKREMISYSQFKQEVLSDRIAKVIYKGDQMTIFGERLDGTRFETRHPIYKRDESVDNAIEEHGVITVFESVEQPSLWSQLLVGAFPILLLLGIFFFFMRQMQGGMSGRGGPMAFGKSKAKLMEGGKVTTTFEDVAGCEEAKQDVQELVDFLRDPTKFQKLGGKIPRGVLMVGPPGTGKTLLARAIAGEAKVPFFSISGSDFVEMFVGVGASRVRDMFEQAQKNSPCIVFIDEIDAVGRHRGAGMGGGHDEREQTLNQLLVEMDGFDGNEGVIVVAATNRPDVLDPALLRPGRFDRQVVVDLPDLRGREQILKVHMKKVPLSKDVDALVIARGTPGFSGADLANLINEAALFAARYGDKKVDQNHLDLAKDKIMMGPERKSMIMTEEQVHACKGDKMKILSFDAESNGLHGNAFALGAVLTDASGPVTEFAARCPVEGSVDQWVARNVIPAMCDIPETHSSYGDMLDAFYMFLCEHSEEAKILTFIPWPVETRVLSDIFSTPKDRWFDGPFPLIDLASVLDALGHNAVSDEDYLRRHNLSVPVRGSSHDPLYDAYVADTVYRHLLST